MAVTVNVNVAGKRKQLMLLLPHQGQGKQHNGQQKATHDILTLRFE